MIEESEQLYKLPALAELLKKPHELPPFPAGDDNFELTIGERWTRWVKTIDN